MTSERLQKILSQAGLGSRREMERWIERGAVQVNGVVAKIGESATAEDIIKVDGKVITNPLLIKQNTRILLYHKPVGEVSSRNDPKFDKTVFDDPNDGGSYAQHIGYAGMRVYWTHFFDYNMDAAAIKREANQDWLSTWYA